jgi:hypothetical protein
MASAKKPGWNAAWLTARAFYQTPIHDNQRDSDALVEERSNATDETARQLLVRPELERQIWNKWEVLEFFADLDSRDGIASDRGTTVTIACVKADPMHFGFANERNVAARGHYRGYAQEKLQPLAPEGLAGKSPRGCFSWQIRFSVLALIRFDRARSFGQLLFCEAITSFSTTRSASRCASRSVAKLLRDLSQASPCSFIVHW